MVIYLKHAVHGTKVAVAEEEAKADEKNGWKRYELDSVPLKPPAAIEAPKAEVISDPTIVSRDELAGEYERKFGKKPHHRMSIARMAQELAA